MHLDSNSDLRAAFLETDRRIQKTKEATASGSTTIVVREVGEYGDTIQLAWLGDSTALVASYDDHRVTILVQASQHKPSSPSENARIRAVGGKVRLPSGSHSSRVFVPTDDDGKMTIKLAMSRCMGYTKGKELGYITAEPSIVEVERPRRGFILVASDGIMYHRNVFQLVAQVASALREGNLANVTREIIGDSMDRWELGKNGDYRDDLTLAIKIV